MSEIIISVMSVITGACIACTVYNTLLINKLLIEYRELLKQSQNSPRHSYQEISKQPHQPVQYTPETLAPVKLNVPTLDPQMISKNLANPPKPKGGFGTSVDGV
jgi:hypothetical protein